MEDETRRANVLFGLLGSLVHYTSVLDAYPLGRLPSPSDIDSMDARDLTKIDSHGVNLSEDSDLASPWFGHCA